MEKKSDIRLVCSRETGKVYRVVREYKYTLMVVAAWKKSGYPFTLPKSCFCDLTHSFNSPEKNMTQQ